MAYPILILAYRRTEELLRVIESVQQLKPSKIYFHIHSAPNEEQQKDVEAVIAVIKSYNGPKEVKYSKEPLGVRQSLYSALKWISSKEEMFFVFEDDVVLNPKSGKKLLQKMGEISRGGVLKFGTNPNWGVYWGWATTSKTVERLLEKNIQDIPYETMRPYFDDKFHYLGVMELYRREAFMAWDDELNMMTKVLGIKEVRIEKPLTVHIGTVSTRTDNGIDKGFGEGSHIMFKNGKMVN